MDYQYGHSLGFFRWVDLLFSDGLDKYIPQIQMVKHGDESHGRKSKKSKESHKKQTKDDRWVVAQLGDLQKTIPRKGVASLHFFHVS